VIDRYRVWHGACHLDDARMAPVDHLHFDGYAQGPSTLCAFAPGRPVPGLDRGGWHDAGDNDLRVESQVQTVWMLSLAREAFGIDHDATTVDQARRTVELGRPDGRPDILEQIQHGALSLTGAHRALGRLYRGIIEPSLVQYRLVGDPVNATDNRVSGAGGGPSSRADDRWVFTEQNPGRDLLSAAGLAAAARVLRGFDDALAADCLRIARTLWDEAPGATPALRTAAAVELLLATGDAVYRDWLLERRDAIAEAIAQTGWLVARVTGAVADARFASAMEGPLRAHAAELVRRAAASPWGVPYQRHPHWGEGWTVLTYGARLHYLCTALPELFPVRLLHQALGFVLGCHPGQNTASFVSGVGARSVMSAYGFNRSDGAHLPGGVVPGTALVAPDFPELLDWPFLWQQTEYLVSAAADYLFLVLAAEHAVAALHR
jgi:hypothetical protein